MADRKIGIKVTAKDEATAVFEMAADEVHKMRKEVEADLKNVGTAAARLRGGASPSQAARALGGAGGLGLGTRVNGPTGFKAINEERESLERALKLGGATALASVIGRSMQGVPEVVAKFRTDIKAGATKTEAYASALAEVIPGVGDLAKGLRAAYDALIESDFDRKQRTSREEQQDLRDIREQQAEKLKARRDPIVQAGNDAATAAGDSLYLAGSRGEVRAIREAQLARNQRERQLNELRGKRGALSPDQAVLLDKQIAQARAAADAELNDRLAEIRRQAQGKIEADAKTHADRMADIEREANAAALERDGRALSLRLQQINDEAKKEQEAVRRRVEDAKKDPDADLYGIENQAKAESEAIERLRQEKARTAAQLDQKEIDDATRDVNATKAEEEARRRSRFRGDLVSGVGGESRLLSGSVGAAASAGNPVVEALTKTTKLAEDQKRLGERMEEHLRAIKEFMTRPSGGNGRAIPL